jgi:RNA polymerase sigma-70 factor (sigma-E family)
VIEETPARAVPVPAARREDQIAELFRVHYRALVVVAALLLDESATAEEVVQDAFAGLVRNWDRLRDPGAAPAYLRRSVVNLARSRLRRLRTSRAHAVPIAASVPSPEDHALLAEEHRAVLVLVRRLPRRQRECLVLRFYLDATPAEIARTLGIAEGSVKAYTHRGLATLEIGLEHE